MTDRTSLLGRWRLDSDSKCDLAHPTGVQFLAEGIYRVEHDGHSFWGGGDWDMTDDILSVQDQRDRMVPYRIGLEGARLVLTDEHGCTIVYRR